tara:strand:+ start:570 stop:851 length:282 start_codon:yes stop_codon:yes gene_type:complete
LPLLALIIQTNRKPQPFNPQTGSNLNLSILKPVQTSKLNNLKTETSNLKTSNLKPQTSNLKTKISNLKPQTSNLKPTKISNLKPQTSNQNLKP